MPKILDACCGSRMFWFDRNNPDVIFADNRKLETTLCDDRTLVIDPDVIIDFRDMPFDDNTFDLVVLIRRTLSTPEKNHGWPRSTAYYLKSGSHI